MSANAGKNIGNFVPNAANMQDRSRYMKPKRWILSFIIFLNFQGAVSRSLNQTITFAEFDSNKNWVVEDQHDVAVIRTSRIATIFVRIADSTSIVLTKWRSMFPDLSRNKHPIPLLLWSEEKDPFTLILIDPSKGGIQEMVEKGCWRIGTKSSSRFW